MGIRRTIEVLGHEASFLGSLDRARIAPWGLSGGKAGGRGAILVDPGQGQRALPSKVWGVRLAPGARVSVITPGAGGWGSPAERTVDRVRDDVEDGVVSPERAATDYPHTADALRASTEISAKG
jgi:N-methylhydantoinase B